MLGQVKGNCASEVAYTGSGICAIQEQKISILLLTGLNTMFPMEDIEDNFIQLIQQGVTAEGTGRIYPVKDIVGMTINGGDINAPDLGTYGGPMPTNLNAKNIAYQINSGDCAYKEYAKLNKRKMRIFRIDEDGVVRGTVVERNGKQYFAGFEATLYTVRIPTDGSTAYNLSLYAYYTPNNEYEEKNMHGFVVGLAAIPDGLLGVVLKKGAATGKASVVTTCGGEDITAEFGDKWTTAMFLNESGAAPTTVTYDNATGLLTFEPAAKYRVAGAAVLAAADITGVDGINQLTDLS